MKLNRKSPSISPTGISETGSKGRRVVALTKDRNREMHPNFKGWGTVRNRKVGEHNSNNYGVCGEYKYR